MDFGRLKTFLQERNEPRYRYNQIVSEIASGRVEGFEEIFTISKDLRSSLDQEVPIISNSLETILISKDKTAYKALLKLSDGSFIETVLLNPKPSLWSVCISCQVGCAMNCRFALQGRWVLKET
jgi:23S rRNA (adenine2503-C2)-methyltransferase